MQSTLSASDSLPKLLAHAGLNAEVDDDEISVRWEKVNGTPRLDYKVPPGIKVVRAECR